MFWKGSIYPLLAKYYIITVLWRKRDERFGDGEGFALAQWYGVGLRFVRSRVRSPAPLSYSEITSGCCDLALAPYGRIHVVNLTMAHMILGSIVHWRHYHQTFKLMRLGGLVIVQWRISSPGIYMVFPLISPLFLFLILTVQLLVKVSSVQPVEHSARVLTKDLSLVPTAASLGTWHSEVRVGGMPYLKQAQLQCACGPLGQRQCISILAGCLPNPYSLLLS